VVSAAIGWPNKRLDVAIEGRQTRGAPLVGGGSSVTMKRGLCARAWRTYAP
jgi:hypothetical protein